MDYDPHFVYFVYDGIYGSDSTYLQIDILHIYIYILMLVVGLFTSVLYMFVVYFMKSV